MSHGSAAEWETICRSWSAAECVDSKVEESIQAMCGSVGVDRRINQREWEQEDWAWKTYLKKILKVAGCKVLYPFLIPNEEHLGGFS